MKHPKSLMKEKLVELVQRIICRLYEDYDGKFDRDREWDSDTLSDIAGIMAQLGLTPEDSHGKDVYEWSKRAKPHIRKVNLHCASIHQRHGTEILVALSEAQIEEQLYEHAKAGWDSRDLPEMPEDPDEAIELYFEAAGGELYRDNDTVTIEIEE